MPTCKVRGCGWEFNPSDTPDSMKFETSTLNTIWDVDSRTYRELREVVCPLCLFLALMEVHLAELSKLDLGFGP